MGTRRRRAAAASTPRAAAPARGSRKASQELLELVQTAIEAKRRGDEAAGEGALRALGEFRDRSSSPALRQAAADAHAAAGYDMPVDSLRLLGEIATRVKSAAP